MSNKVHYLNNHLEKFREKNKITIDVENIGDLASGFVLFNPQFFNPQ